MKTIKVKIWLEVPKDFTGIAEYLNGDKYWYKKGKFGREDGPAIELFNGCKQWWIDDKSYSLTQLESLIETSIYLGKKENGNYNLEWLLFLTDQGIKEFPIIPGMIETELLKEYLDAVQ